MRINRVIKGQYSEIQLEDGKKIFISVLPDRITVSTMFLFIPTKKFWEFIFPFYIRTSAEAWKSSSDILEITLKSIKDVSDLEELKERLENSTSASLRAYIKNHSEEAKDISVDKVGTLAIKQMLEPKGLQKIENIVHKFGKVLEETSQQTMTKYPAVVYPESLLPYPKEVIRKALKNAQNYTDDENMKINLRSCEVSLDRFIDDKEANRKNSELLNSEEYQKALRKHRKPE